LISVTFSVETVQPVCVLVLRTADAASAAAPPSPPLQPMQTSITQSVRMNLVAKDFTSRVFSRREGSALQPRAARRIVTDPFACHHDAPPMGAGALVFLVLSSQRQRRQCSFPRARRSRQGDSSRVSPLLGRAE
jgi:hypothetical protein